MPDVKNKDRERALIATGEELAGLVHHPSADVLLALLENPALDETHVCLLLERKDLRGEILEEVARRKPLLKSYRVKRALAFHPRTPRLVSLRLLRDLYLMDLVQITLLPGISAELKLNAEEQLLARLAQLPLGQKITLARRGPARVAGALLAEGHAQVVSIVLDNPYLTEAQILRVLSREKLPAPVIPASLAIANGPLPTTCGSRSCVNVRRRWPRFFLIFPSLPSPTCGNWRPRASFQKTFASICRPKCNAGCVPGKERRVVMLPLMTLPSLIRTELLLFHS